MTIEADDVVGPASKGGFFGPVVGCVLRDDLADAAKAGDTDAVKRLLPFISADLPSSAVIAWRDDQIRAVAGWLFKCHLEEFSNHHLATVIACAGGLLLTRRDLPNKTPFDKLSDGERWVLGIRIRWILERCARWPKLRQTLTILAG